MDPGDGLAWAAGLEGKEWAFDHFVDFPDYLGMFMREDDEHAIGPWVAERHASILDPRDYDDGPRLAVTFGLYYNALKIGLVRFKPLSSHSVPDGSPVRAVCVQAEIDFAPLLPHDHVRRLLMLLADHLAYDAEGRDDHAMARIAVTEEMQAVLWDARRRQDDAVKLGFAYYGHTHPGKPLRRWDR